MKFEYNVDQAGNTLYVYSINVTSFIMIYSSGSVFVSTNKTEVPHQPLTKVLSVVTERKFLFPT